MLFLQWWQRLRIIYQVYKTKRSETACTWPGGRSTMGDKSVETLDNKIEFLSIPVTFSPFPPKQCWFFWFFDCTDHSAYTTLNWGAGGIRELTLEANKIEQMLKYRKASFPKSVSTTFVAHCSSHDKNIFMVFDLTAFCLQAWQWWFVCLRKFRFFSSQPYGYCCPFPTL